MPMPFTKPSLSDLEEEEEYQRQNRKVLEEKVAIHELNQKLGKGGWKLFSSNGQKSGFSISKAIAWLRTH